MSHFNKKKYGEPEDSIEEEDEEQDDQEEETSNKCLHKIFF